MSGSERPEPLQSPRTKGLLFTVALLAIAALYLYGAGAFPLTEPDETRYAEIGREMVVRDDWVTPHLNFVKYFEKPPLVYWATAAAFRTLGVGELAARLPALLSGLVTLGVTTWLAASMYGATTALVALPILALGPLFGILAQTLTLDMPLTGCMTLALVAIWFGWSGASAGAGGRGWYRAAYVATALGVLVKGPVAAVLVAAIAAVFLPLHGGWRSVRAALDWRGIALAAVVALPWFALVSWRNPEFLHFFVVDQHIARYLWASEHGEPIWFFLPVLLIAFAPWGLVLLFDPPLLRAMLAPRTWSVATRFLVIWAAVIVAFFSLSSSKLLTYVLPAIPPLAVLTARALVLGVARARTAGLARVAWLLLVGGPIMSLCGALIPMASAHWRALLIAPYLLAGGPVLMATGGATRLMLVRQRPWAGLGALAVGWFAIFAVAVAGRGAANDYRALGLAARAAMGPDDRLSLYGSFIQGIGFYSGRRTIMVGHSGELEFGSRQGDQRAWFWPEVSDLRREWAGPGRLFLVINRKDLEAFEPPLDPPPVLVAAKDRKVLVANR